MSKLLERYADAYNTGDINAENYAQCASYLEGLRDGLTQQLSDEAIQRLIRAETCLRGAANLVYWLRRQPDSAGEKP